MTRSGGFTQIDLVILIVYLVAVLFVGIIFSKKDMKGKEFFKGDGTIPWWVTSVSVFATLLSPISFLALAGNSYAGTWFLDMKGKEFFKGDGTIPWWVTSVSVFATLLSPISFLALAGNSYAGTWFLWFAQLGLFIAVPLTIKFFLPVYSRLDIDTAYHYLEIRFGSKLLRILGALMFIIYQVGRMSIIMYLPCVALSPLIGIKVETLIIVMGVIAIIYSYTGGIKSVLWTDFIQGLVLILGVIFALVYLLSNIKGGLGTVFNELVNNQKLLSADQKLFDINILKSSAFILVLGGGLNTFASFVSSQDIVQRFTTTTDKKKLNKMMLTNGVLSLFVATVFYLIGTALAVFYNGNADVADIARDKIFAHYIAYELPVVVTGLLLAAIYAAAQSTLSTGLNSVATSWSLDIQPYISKNISEEQQTRLARYISLGVGVLTIVVSIKLANGDITSAYETFNAFMGLVLGVLVGIFILGVFTKKANAGSTLLAFIAASVVILLIKIYVKDEYVTSWSYSIISITVSLVVGLLTSGLFKNNAPTDERATIYYKD